MSSNYQHTLNKHITTLTSQLLTTYINMPQSHPQHHSYVNYIKKYLNDKSMLFIPRQKDVEKELDVLCEKLIINSQLEKSQLLYNYVNRLKAIYESKPVIIKENLFSFIHLVLSLAHNPLKTVVNIDIMKEEFETRYIMNKIGMYIKNRNYIPDEIKEIQYDKGDNNIFEFEEVDYNEKTPTWSEDEDDMVDKEDEHVNEVNIITNDNNEIQNDICNNENHQQICKDVIEQQLPDKDKLQLMFTHFYKLFLNKPYFSNMSFSFFTHLLNLNSRIHPIITHSTQLTLHVDNDFLLLQLLHNLTTTPSTITSFPSLTLPFTNLIPIDLPSPLLSSLLTTFNTTYHNLSFLHHISSIFTSHNIHTSTTSKLCSIIFDFLTYHNTCLDAFAKLLHYQKGKIENSHSTFIKHIITTFPTTKYTYINTMLSHTETCINTLYTSKSKLSLFIFINFYTEHIQHIVNYFTLICKSIIQTKENNINTSNNNAVLVKRILDGMYRMAWGANEEMHIEVFVMLCEEYAKFIYEFIVNGNLLDVWNECFFEHAKVKHEKKKIVFCFDEKFKIFNWVDSFKIKSYVNENGNDAACVPIAFMLGNIHFKILETAKTMFLMKNLNVANYFDDMNKEVLMCKEEEEEKNEKVNDVNGKERNGSNDDEDVLEDLRMLNERIRIRKEEINEKGKELNMLEFALNNEVKKLNINNMGCNDNVMVNNSSSNNNCDVFEFQQSGKYVNSNDIDMYNNNYTDDDNEQSTTCISGCNNNNNDNSVNFIQRISCFNTTNLNSSNESELKEISSLINLHNHPNYHSLTLSSSPPQLHNYNINLILHKLILNRIITINTLINQKFLSILTTSLHIQHHFNLIFHIFLFKAGFSMNKFILHLNNFILSPNSHDKNFDLKTLLNTLSTSPQSDLSPFKSQILQHISIHFNSSISSYTYHSDDDLLTLSYTPPSPINIFFDDQVIKHYNIIFNLLIKMKRSFILIRDINLDKKIKELFILCNNNECTYMKVIKVLIEYRMFMLDFAYEFEFFVFHFVIDVFVNRFNNMVSKFDSIDKFINMHYRFIRDLIMYLGINDNKYMKKVYKVMNMIVVFPSLVNRLMCINRDNHEEMQYFLMEVDNSMEKFIRKKNKLINLINIIKDKLNNI